MLLGACVYLDRRVFLRGTWTGPIRIRSEFVLHVSLVMLDQKGALQCARDRALALIARSS